MRRHAERRAFARIDGGGWTYTPPGLSVVIRARGHTVKVRVRWFFWLLFLVGLLLGTWQ